MAAAPSPSPKCRHCTRCGGGHYYDCPVLRDTGTAPPRSGKWWERQ